MYVCLYSCGTVSVRSCSICLTRLGLGGGGKSVGPLAMEAATVASSTCIAPSAKIVSICPMLVPRGIIISVGPQLMTGMTVLLLKLV